MPALTQPDVIAVLRMRPEAIMRYLGSRGFALTWNWQEALDAIHSQVFVVAKCTKLDVLQAIQSALANAIEKGQTFAQFQDDIKPILQSKGWWGKAVDPSTGEIVATQNKATTAAAQYGSARRLWTIYQTNLQSAFMIGRYQTMIAAVETHPYWRYVAVADSRTRPAHMAMHGRVYRHDDPIWSYWYPPNGFRCRCRIMPVSQHMMQRQQWRTRASVDEPISVDQIMIGRGEDARQATVASFHTRDGNGRRVTVATDPGFAYNPGAAAWHPDQNRWSGELAGIAKRVLSLPVPAQGGMQ